MTANETQLDLLKLELELMQRQLDKYDQLSATTKTWAVTLWAAILGWSFQSGRKELAVLAILIAAAFWLFDAVNKNFRTDYKARRDELSLMLQSVFKGEALPASALSPVFPAHDLRGVVKSAIQPHIFLLYIALIAVAYLLQR